MRARPLRDDGEVKVELLLIPGCPGAEDAAGLLRTALDDIGLTDFALGVGLIDSRESAQARAFGGSPAFVVDGTDLLPITGSVGVMACRVYPTSDGLRNVPDLHELRLAREGALTGTD